MAGVRAPERRRTFFLHVFNDQMHRNYGLHRNRAPQALARALSTPVKLAYLAAEESLLIPTMDLVESGVLAVLLEHLQPLIQVGDLRFCGSSVDPEDFFRRKRQHYSSVHLYPQYFTSGLTEKLHAVNTSLVTRTVRTTADVALRWQQDIESASPEEVGAGGRLLAAAYSSIRRDGESMIHLADTLHALPEFLTGEALLWEIAEQRGYLGAYAHPPFAHPLRLLLAQKWLLSHIEEYDAALLVNVPGLGGLDCGLAAGPVRHPACVDVAELARWFEVFGLSAALRSASFATLVELKRSAHFRYFRGFWRQAFMEGGRSPAWHKDAEARIRLVLERRPWTANRRSLERVGPRRYLGDRVAAVADELARWADRPVVPDIAVRGGWLSRSVVVNVGDIIGGENVIAVGTGATGGKASIMGDKINITTGDVTNSPGAVTVNSTIGNIDVAIGELAAASGTVEREVARIVAELKAQLEQQAVLPFQATLSALLDLDTVTSAVAGNQGDQAAPGAAGKLRQAVTRLVEVAHQLDPVFTTTSSLVAALRDVLGLG